jgi:predicted DNA-binding transcriptional regulator AlpA
MSKRKVLSTSAAQEQKSQQSSVAVVQEELEPLLDINELVAILRVCRPKIYDLMRCKGLPSVTIGDRRFFIPSSIRLWMKQQETTAF